MGHAVHQRSHIGMHTCKYRLGDVVKGYSARNYGGWDSVKDLHQCDWPASIATAYLIRTDKWNQFDTLCDIVRDFRHNGDVPLPNEVVVHLRVGDTIGGPLGDAATHWENPGVAGSHYVKSRSYYERAIAALRPHRHIRNVTIIGWAHHCAQSWGPLQSEVYGNLVKALFESNGYQVSTRRDHHVPDDDFVYMAHAPYFIYGGGGFSGVAGECVHRLGGTTPIQWEAGGGANFSAYLAQDSVS